MADRLLTLPGGDDVDFSIVTRRPTFTDIPELLFRARTAEAATRMAQATVKRRWFRINKRIRRLSEREGYGVVDLTEVVCPAGLCDIVDGDRPLYHDSNHWTLAGAELFGRRLADQGFFDQLLKRYLGAAPQT